VPSASLKLPGLNFWLWSLAMRSCHLSRTRPFEPRDLDHVASAANRAVWKSYAFFGYDHPVSVTRARLIEALQEGSEFWVSEVSGIPVGILGLYPNFIDKLFIAPEWQSAGAGSALIDCAKSLYPTHLELHCAQENHVACRFYERHGFRAKAYRMAHSPLIPEIVFRWERR
jgi:GNAT superfamily N-acetyltransferase